MLRFTISNGNVLEMPETAHPKTNVGGCGRSPASECTSSGCVEAQNLPAEGVYFAGQGGAASTAKETVVPAEAQESL